jgi:hypothetical protein
MKIAEILFESTLKFAPELIKFWKSHADQLPQYFRGGETGCAEAAQELAQELGGFAEVVPIGHYAGSKKVGGWIRTDVVQTDLESFTSRELTIMRQQNLDPKNPSDRKKFIENNNLQDEFMWVPHSWVEIRGQILDPSGFYLDGTSGQFDGMISDKHNLLARYQYF